MILVTWKDDTGQLYKLETDDPLLAAQAMGFAELYINLVTTV